MKKLILSALAGVVTLCGVISCKHEVYYVVTFDSTGGSTVARQVVQEGSYATRPTNPSRSGYVFANWYHDKAATKVFNFTGEPINAYITVYAGWTAESGSSMQALNSLIADMSAVNKDDYTSSSWEAMQAALAVAKLTATTSGVTDGQVAEALKNLQNAAGALVFIGDLNSVITAAGSANRADYTESGWSALQNALTEAKKVAANPNATKDQVAKALSDLQNAQSNKATSPTPDKSGLNAAITAVKALPEGAYTVDSWKNLKTALTTAENVASDSAATQKQITDALTALNNATSGLVLNTSGQTTVADKSALNTSITSADGKVQSEYTADSWNAMQSALTEAKKVAANPAASQAQVDAAKASLDRAVAALQHVETSNSSADKSALNSFIADSDKLVQSNYTADSWSVFQNALNDAKTTAANPSATQQQINTAYTNLETAVNNLALQQTNTGVVSGLVNQLTSLVNSLPSADLIQSSPLLSAVATPLATLADQVRDQLIPLVGDTNTEVNALGNQLNGILNALNLGSLI